jgi:hypothetical protein
MDTSALMEQPVFIATKNESSWSINVQSGLVDYNDLGFAAGEYTLTFDPFVPYIYLPP